jgi:hypothetical protein
VKPHFFTREKVKRFVPQSCIRSDRSANISPLINFIVTLTSYIKDIDIHPVLRDIILFHVDSMLMDRRTAGPEGLQSLFSSRLPPLDWARLDRGCLPVVDTPAPDGASARTRLAPSPFIPTHDDGEEPFARALVANIRFSASWAVGVPYFHFPLTNSASLIENVGRCYGSIQAGPSASWAGRNDAL